MFDRKRFKWKGIIIGLLALLGCFCISALLELFPMSVTPVEYAEAPSFLTSHEERVGDAAELVPPNSAITGSVSEQAPDNGSGVDAEAINALAKSTVLKGESPEQLLALLMHEDYATRTEAARALAEAHWETMHGKDGTSNQNMSQFWQRVEQPDVARIQKALFEAFAESVEKGVGNFNLPYLIAWMPDTGQEDQRIELLAWAANHHSTAWMRRSTMFYVVGLRHKSGF